jgi:hypothetical protein
MILTSRTTLPGKLAVVRPAARSLPASLSITVARAKALNQRAITYKPGSSLKPRGLRAMGFEKTGETAHPGFDRATSFTFTLPVR